MRILVITQRWYPDTFGGSELVAAEQARRLAERGHEVTVLAERVIGYGPPLGGGAPPPSGGSIAIHRYGTPQQFARMGGRSRTDVEEVEKWVKGEKGDWEVVILHHPFTAYGFFSAQGGSASGGKVPTLYMFHASTAAEVAWERTRWPHLTPLFVWWAWRVERTVLRRADRIAVFSEFSRRVVEELAPEVKDKVVKLSVGVDTKENHSAIRANRRMANGGMHELLTVRRLTPRMGLMELVQAIAVVKLKLAVHLTIVGEGPMRGVLEREIAKLGLQSCVMLTGRVAADKLPRYYQEADLFVLSTQAYEGLGMATLEALASGLPVVGTPVGATLEVLGDLDPTLITKSASVQGITQGILDFFARPEKERMALRRKVRAWAEKQYNWEKAVDELERVLHDLCASCR